MFLMTHSECFILSYFHWIFFSFTFLVYFFLSLSSVFFGYLLSRFLSLSLSLPLLSLPISLFSPSVFAAFSLLSFSKLIIPLHDFKSTFADINLHALENPFARIYRSHIKVIQFLRCDVSGV